jgi:hypothetical protein
MAVLMDPIRKVRNVAQDPQDCEVIDSYFKKRTDLNDSSLSYLLSI